MKKLNKKGFTIVELVIVIAVIAILAGVLIPTFSGIVEKANKSAALSEARTIFTQYVAATADDGTTEDDLYIEVDGYYFQVADGVLNDEPTTTSPTEAGTLIVSGVGEDDSVESETVPEA